MPLTAASSKAASGTGCDVLATDARHHLVEQLVAGRRLRGCRGRGDRGPPAGP